MLYEWIGEFATPAFDVEECRTDREPNLEEQDGVFALWGIQ